MAKLDESQKKLKKVLKDIGVNVSSKQISDASKKVNSGGSSPSKSEFTPKTVTGSYGNTLFYSDGTTSNDVINKVDTSTGISDTEVEQLAKQGYREGDNVPGRGILLPDGTFKQTTTPPTAPVISDADFIKKMADIGVNVTQDQINATRTGVPVPVQETTPTDILDNIPGETALDKRIAEGEDTLLKIKQELAKPETDEEMRTRLTALFQQEIDALNAVYAQQKQEATKAGLAALGTNRAQQARFGLLGSSFGTAETKGIEEETTQKKASIDVNAQAALAPIYSKISDEIIAAKKEKRTAQMDSAEAYIASLKSQKEKKAQIATNAIKNMILNKANPTDKDFETMAKQIGVDPVLFKQEYMSELGISESSSLKAAQDQAKLEMEIAQGTADLSQPKDIGDYTYMYNPNTGQWENMGLNKKATSTGEMTTRQNVVFNSIITKSNAIDSANATFNVAKATAERLKANPKNAQTQLSNLYQYVKTLDANSAVREGETQLASATGSLLERLQRAYESYVRDGSTVGSDLAVKMADEAIALADAWLRESQRQKNNLQAQAKTNGIENEFLSTINYAGELNQGLEAQNSIKNKIIAAGYDYDAIKRDNPNVSDSQLLSDLGIQ